MLHLCNRHHPHQVCWMRLNRAHPILRRSRNQLQPNLHRLRQQIRWVQQLNQLLQHHPQTVPLAMLLIRHPLIRHLLIRHLLIRHLRMICLANLK